MAIRTTQWKPDTCGCVVQYTWDDSVAQEDRVHSLSTIQKCAFHQSQSDSTAFASVNDENITKNQVLGHVLENYPLLVDEKADGSKELKLGYHYDWSFDDQRKLQAEIIGADKATAQAIAASVEADLGAGKVDVKIP